MTTLEERARAGAAAVARGDAPSVEELNALHRILDSHLAAKFATSTRDLRLDARDEAVVRFVAAASTSSVDHVSALAYLTTITTHTMIDLLRRDRVAQRRLRIAAEETADDEAIARLIEANATGQTIEDLLRHLAASGDYIATRVLNAFLYLAERDGESPSYRTVAVEAAVSHTAVGKVLARARTFLGDGFTQGRTDS